LIGWPLNSAMERLMSMTTSIRNSRNLRYSKERRIPIMEPNVDQPKALNSNPDKSGNKSGEGSPSNTVMAVL